MNSRSQSFGELRKVANSIDESALNLIVSSNLYGLSEEDIEELKSIEQSLSDIKNGISLDEQTFQNEIKTQNDSANLTEKLQSLHKKFANSVALLDQLLPLYEQLKRVSFSEKNILKNNWKKAENNALLLEKDLNDVTERAEKAIEELEEKIEELETLRQKEVRETVDNLQTLLKELSLIEEKNDGLSNQLEQERKENLKLMEEVKYLNNVNASLQEKLQSLALENTQLKLNDGEPGKESNQKSDPSVSGVKLAKINELVRQLMLLTNVKKKDSENDEEEEEEEDEEEFPSVFILQKNNQDLLNKLLDEKEAHALTMKQYSDFRTVMENRFKELHASYTITLNKMKEDSMKSKYSNNYNPHNSLRGSIQRVTTMRLQKLSRASSEESIQSDDSELGTAKIQIEGEEDSPDYRVKKFTRVRTSISKAFPPPDTKPPFIPSEPQKKGGEATPLSNSSLRVNRDEDEKSILKERANQKIRRAKWISFSAIILTSIAIGFFVRTFQ